MESNWRTLAALSGMVLGLGLTAAVAQTSLSEQDREFIEDAAESSHAEISMGKSAAESKNTAVADFGKQMIQEHSAMNEELAGIARQKGVEPPASPDLGSQATGAAIGVLPGETFDSQYINQQISAHQSTLELLQKQAQEGQDPDLKAFAQKYVPVVQHHLDEANRIKGQMQ